MSGRQSPLTGARVADFGKAATYFRPVKDYHGPYEISLPCSEWERVEHSWQCHLTESRNGFGING